VVVGGAYAGLLAAHALAEHFERVTVCERDLIDEETEFHPGALNWTGRVAPSPESLAASVIPLVPLARPVNPVLANISPPTSLSTPPAGPRNSPDGWPKSAGSVQRSLR